MAPGIGIGRIGISLGIGNEGASSTFGPGGRMAVSAGIGNGGGIGNGDGIEIGDGSGIGGGIGICGRGIGLWWCSGLIPDFSGLKFF